MGKPELKNLPDKELTDEELSKVAGGKDWDADDLETGQCFINVSTKGNRIVRYYYIYEKGSTNVKFREWKINTEAANDCFSWEYEKDINTFLKWINDGSLEQVKSYPSRIH